MDTVEEKIQAMKKLEGEILSSQDQHLVDMMKNPLWEQATTLLVTQQRTCLPGTSAEVAAVTAIQAIANLMALAALVQQPTAVPPNQQLIEGEAAENTTEGAADAPSEADTQTDSKQEDKVEDGESSVATVGD